MSVTAKRKINACAQGEKREERRETRKERGREREGEREGESERERGQERSERERVVSGAHIACAPLGKTADGIPQRG
jgi:hypothetical protein